MKLQKDDIEKALIFHFDSVSLTDEPELSAIYQALDYVRHNNLIISFDVNYRKVLWKNKELALSRIGKAIKVANLVKLNSHELRLLSGEKEISKSINRILEILKNESNLDNVTNESLEKILLYSNATGAITSSKNGVIPVLPTKNELANFFDSIG